MTTYYLNSALGDDTNSGTGANAAFQTLSKINSLNLNPGDQVIIAGNTTYTGYFFFDSNDVGSAISPILVKWDGVGTKPTISNTTEIIGVDGGSYITFSGLKLTGAQYSGLHTYPTSSHITLTNTEISNSGEGVAAEGQYGLYTDNYIHDLNMIVNTVGGEDDYGAVAFVFFSNNQEAANNTIVNAKAPSFDFGFDGGGFETWKSVSNIYIHNNSVTNSAGFFEAGGEAGDVVGSIRMAYNISANNGFFTYLHNSGTFFVTFTGVEVDHNTIYDPSFTIPVSFSAAPSSWYYFHDNIVTSSSGSTVYNQTVTNRSNNFYNGGVPGAETGGLSGNPLYVNAAGGDFHLQPGSPAIGKGAYPPVPLNGRHHFRLYFHAKGHENVDYIMSDMLTISFDRDTLFSGLNKDIILADNNLNNIDTLTDFTPMSAIIMLCLICAKLL